MLLALRISVKPGDFVFVVAAYVMLGYFVSYLFSQKKMRSNYISSANKRTVFKKKKKTWCGTAAEPHDSPTVKHKARSDTPFFYNTDMLQFETTVHKFNYFF